MRILLTNDDGLYAPGIKALATMLSPMHDVSVIAPDQERSGVGHAFTLGKGLTCLEDDQVFQDLPVLKVWKCSGTPVDCVKMGLLVFLKDARPDLIVSGINKGANLSLDHLYSGTVAAALEGTLASIPAISISVSQNAAGGFPFETAAGVLQGLLQKDEFTGLLSKNHSLNVNVPGCAPDQIKGYRLTSIGKCYYEDCYVPQHRGGVTEYVLSGTPCITDKRDSADNVAVRDGYVSITPFAPDLTSYTVLESIGKTTL